MRTIILVAAFAFAVAALPAPPGLVPSHVRRRGSPPKVFFAKGICSGG